MAYSQDTAAISPKRLLILRELERTQSIKRAATALYMSEPAIRANLASLEQAIGGTLKRTDGDDRPGVYRLSELGQEVLKRGTAIIQQCEAITQLGASRPPAVAFLPHHAVLLAEVCKMQPDPTRLMNMQVLGESERSEIAYQDRVLGRLAAGGIEVAVGHPAVARSLKSEPLYRTSYRAMVPKDAEGDVISLANLARRGLLLPPKPTRSRSLLDKSLAREGLEADIVLEAYQTKVLVLMGWAGLGTVVLPADLARLYDRDAPFGGREADEFKWVKVADNEGRLLNHKVNVTTRGTDAASGVNEIVRALHAATKALHYDTTNLVDAPD